MKEENNTQTGHTGEGAPKWAFAFGTKKEAAMQLSRELEFESEDIEESFNYVYGDPATWRSYLNKKVPELTPLGAAMKLRRATSRNYPNELTIEEIAECIRIVQAPEDDVVINLSLKDIRKIQSIGEAPVKAKCLTLPDKLHVFKFKSLPGTHLWSDDKQDHRPELVIDSVYIQRVPALFMDKDLLETHQGIYVGARPKDKSYLSTQQLTGRFNFESDEDLYEVLTWEMYPPMNYSEAISGDFKRIMRFISNICLIYFSTQIQETAKFVEEEIKSGRIQDKNAKKHKP